MAQDDAEPLSFDPGHPPERVWVGEWLVEPGLNRVRRGDESRALEPKVLELLLYLAAAAGRTVPKAELLERVWSGRAVVEAVLTRAISEIRAALGETPRQPRTIQTVPRKGYRLVAAVRVEQGESQPSIGERAVPERGRTLLLRHWAWCLAAVATAAMVVAVLAASGGRALGPARGFVQSPTLEPVPAAAAPRLPGATELSAQPNAVDPEALRLYLLGRSHWSRRDPESLERARALFGRATAQDPQFAEAWAGLADALNLLASYYRLKPAEALPWSREAAERALELAPDLAQAHASLGLVHLNLDWDPAAALGRYEEALRTNPGYASAHQWRAEALSISGRHEEALAAIETAARLEPPSPLIHGAWGQRLNQAGRHREALVKLADALELAPSLAWAHRERAYAFERLGDVAAALAERRLEMVERGLAGADLSALDRAVAEAGIAGFWRWQLGILERRAERRWVPAALLAEALAGAGDNRRALAALVRARSESAEIFLLIRHSPAFDAVRDLPSFPGVERSG